MQYTNIYHSPMGNLLLAADDIGLTGIWFEGGKYYAAGLEAECEERNLLVFEQTRNWLDIYFSGKEPDFVPPLHLKGTSFQLAVWEILQQIPYGKTITYGDIARTIAKEKEIERMSAQAVGGAVGHNPISIIVPCHRVVGANGNLTGYAGGLDKKIKLLEIEGFQMTNFLVPKKGTAL